MTTTSHVTNAEILSWLYAEHAGMEVSGDSGSGKSNLLEVLIEQMMDRDQPFIFLDPHGQSARRIEQHIARLPHRRRSQFYIFRPADPSCVLSLNPLAVPFDQLPPSDLEGTLSTKSEIVRQILLSIWGETDVYGKPRLNRWLTYITDELVRRQLTLIDAEHYVDFSSQHFGPLSSHMYEPAARRAFQELATRRPADADEQIDSTRTRIFGLTSRPAVRRVLGRSDEEVLRIGDVIQSGKSIVADLSPGSTQQFGSEGQQIIANLLLFDFLHTVQCLPLSSLRPYFVVIDELPVFAASAPVIERALRECRKFLVRFVLAHQGLSGFERGEENELLNNVLSHCGIRIYFKHHNHRDADFFAKQLALKSYRKEKVKYAHSQPVQWQTGWKTHETISRSVQVGDSDSTGASQGETTQRTKISGADVGDTVHFDVAQAAIDEARRRSTTHRQSSGVSDGQSTDSHRNWSRTVSRQEGVTVNQTLLPVYEERQIVTSVQFETFDEHVIDRSQDLAQLATGTGIVDMPGRGIATIPFPLATDHYAGAPKSAAKKREEFRQWRTTQPEYASEPEIVDGTNVFRQTLLTQLQQPPRLAAPAAPSPDPKAGSNIGI